MNSIKRLTAISVFSFLVLCLPAIASAQYSGQNHPCGRNGGYGNGQYGNYGSYGDTRSTLRDLKNRSRELQRQIDRELDYSRLNGSRREDQINEVARRFKDAVGDIDNSYNNRRDNDMRRVLDLASQLDRAISRSGLSYNVKNNWSGIRNALQVLGNGYGYNNNNRSPRNSRYPQNGNGRNNRPSWWPF